MQLCDVCLASGDFSAKREGAAASADGRRVEKKEETGVILVPERGLEPPLPCENQLLKLARLPIPPFGHYRQPTAREPAYCGTNCISILPFAARFVNAGSTNAVEPIE